MRRFSTNVDDDNGNSKPEVNMNNYGGGANQAFYCVMKSFVFTRGASPRPGSLCFLRALQKQIISLLNGMRNVNEPVFTLKVRDR